MIPHEKEDARQTSPPPGATRTKGWEMLPIILGAAIIVIVSLMYFGGEQDDPNPVTGRDAPSTSEQPSK